MKIPTNFFDKFRIFIYSRTSWTKTHFQWAGAGSCSIFGWQQYSTCSCWRFWESLLPLLYLTSIPMVLCHPGCQSWVEKQSGCQSLQKIWDSGIMMTGVCFCRVTISEQLWCQIRAIVPGAILLCIVHKSVVSQVLCISFLPLVCATQTTLCLCLLQLVPYRQTVWIGREHLWIFSFG